MEAEKKRKREENGGERRRKEAEPKAVEAPSEEEVEEFFAILRRMQVAVKYFEKNGSSNIDDVIIGEVNLNGDERKVTALESEVDGVKVGEKEKNGGGLELDLNAVPETEEGV